MDAIQFTAPVDNNNKDWKKKKNYRPTALVTVLLLGMAFLAGNSYASYGRTAPDGSVSTMGGYPYVQLNNNTPYAVAPSEKSNWNYVHAGVAYYAQLFCHDDFISEGIAPGDTWIATSCGLCSVVEVEVSLTLPDDSQLTCRHYHSVGTRYSLFSILMDSVDGCCVKSGHENQVC